MTNYKSLICTYISPIFIIRIFSHISYIWKAQNEKWLLQANNGHDSEPTCFAPEQFSFVPAFVTAVLMTATFSSEFMSCINPFLRLHHFNSNRCFFNGHTASVTSLNTRPLRLVHHFNKDGLFLTTALLHYCASFVQRSM